MPSTFQHIDPRGLIDAVGGDRSTFDHLVGMFLRSTPATRDSLQAALEEAQSLAQGEAQRPVLQAGVHADPRATARRLAHQLRGNVVIFGASALAASLSTLEQALHDGVPSAQLQAHCLGLIDAVLAEMRAALAEGEAGHPG